MATRVIILILICLHSILLLADFVAPYPYDLQDRQHPFASPTPVHLLDRQGRLHLRPFIYRIEATQAESSMAGIEAREVPIRFFVQADCHRLLGLIPTRLRLFGTDGRTDGGARVFLLGTDSVGRDVFSRLLYGGRVSVFAGLTATAVALALGLLFGGLAGYYGSGTDESIMGVAEVFLSIPWLYLLLSVRALLPLHVDAVGVFLLLIVVLGVIGWARPARLIRGVTLSAREREFVPAARGFGASDMYILRRHILPEASAVALTQALLYIPQFVLAEVTLSFFGLGVSEPVPSWGNMLTALQESYVLQSCPWMFAPAAALIVIFLGYYLSFSYYRNVSGE